MSIQAADYYAMGYEAGRKDMIKVLEDIRKGLHETAEMHEDGDYYLRDVWIDEYFDKYMGVSDENNQKDNP